MVYSKALEDFLSLYRLCTNLSFVREKTCLLLAYSQHTQGNIWIHCTVGEILVNFYVRTLQLRWITLFLPHWTFSTMWLVVIYVHARTDSNSIMPGLHSVYCRNNTMTILCNVNWGRVQCSLSYKVQCIALQTVFYTPAQDACQPDIADDDEGIISKLWQLQHAEHTYRTERYPTRQLAG